MFSSKENSSVNILWYKIITIYFIFYIIVKTVSAMVVNFHVIITTTFLYYKYIYFFVIIPFLHNIIIVSLLCNWCVQLPVLTTTWHDFISTINIHYAIINIIFYILLFFLSAIIYCTYIIPNTVIPYTYT